VRRVQGVGVPPGQRAEVEPSTVEVGVALGDDRSGTVEQQPVTRRRKEDDGGQRDPEPGSGDGSERDSRLDGHGRAGGDHRRGDGGEQKRHEQRGENADEPRMRPLSCGVAVVTVASDVTVAVAAPVDSGHDAAE